MCQNESFCWMANGTDSPSSSEIQCLVQLCFTGLDCNTENVSSGPPPPTPPALPTQLRALRSLTGRCDGPERLESGHHLWQGWRSFGGFVWAQGMQHWSHVHNLLRNIPWAENVFFLFSPPLLPCQAGTMVPLRGAAGRGYWQGGWK